MKKTLACIVALALAAGMLAACGQGGSSVSTPPQGGAAEKVPVYGGMEVPAGHVPGFAEKLPANG